MSNNLSTKSMADLREIGQKLGIKGRSKKELIEKIQHEQKNAKKPSSKKPSIKAPSAKKPVIKKPTTKIDFLVKNEGIKDVASTEGTRKIVIVKTKTNPAGQAFYQSTGRNSTKELGQSSGGTWLPFNGQISILNLHRKYPSGGIKKNYIYETDLPLYWSHWFDKAVFNSCDPNNNLDRMGTKEFAEISMKMGGDFWQDENGKEIIKKLKLNAKECGIYKPLLEKIKYKPVKTSHEINMFIGKANYQKVDLTKAGVDTKFGKTYDFLFIRNEAPKNKEKFVKDVYNWFYEFKDTCTYSCNCPYWAEYTKAFGTIAEVMNANKCIPK